MKYDVFISYSSQDQKIVEGICAYLEARGIRCFVAYRDIPRGVVWAGAIVDALDESSMMLVAFSDSFNQSKQVDREIELAAEDDKPILTFRLSESRFNGAKRYYLKNLNWIDAFPDPDKAFGELYKNVCKLLGKEEKTDSTISEEIKLKVLKYFTDSLEQSQQTEQNSTSNNERESNSLESELVFDPSKGEFQQKKEIRPSSGFINGHEWVDLGLPSGLKWATYNVGASKPEEYGDYFAWGEIKTKSSYIEENSETNGKDIAKLLRQGYLDEGTGNLSQSHDAAQKIWGGTWRMPTQAEIEELISNTTSEWTVLNGVNGCLIRRKKNKNSIFLPAAGWIFNSAKENDGKYGSYWGSTPRDDMKEFAFSLDLGEKEFSLDLGEKEFELGDSYRDGGMPIRPVSY